MLDKNVRRFSGRQNEINNGTENYEKQKNADRSKQWKLQPGNVSLPLRGRREKISDELIS